MLPERRAQLLEDLARINREIAQTRKITQKPLRSFELIRALDLLTVLQESRRALEAKLDAELRSPLDTNSDAELN
jgi:hypothetical protein